MEVIQTAIEGVVIIEPRLFNDARGYFFESFSQRDFDRLVRTVHFVQDNESKSSYGVLSGLHFQNPPYAQSKLVRVISVLTPEVIFQYKCDNFYAPQSEGALAWDDPDLGINWRIPSDKILLSEKDKRHPRLKDAEWLFDYSEDLYQ